MKRKFLFGLLCILAFFPLSGVVMFFWNLILPPLIHVPVINYLQALGLMVLCRILFGGFGFGGRNDRRHREGAPSFLKNKLKDMSEEERTTFKEEWRKRKDGYQHHP